jgi:DNA-binding NarL/FixJ family response regulator
MGSIKVLLADDHPSMRAGVRGRLDIEPDIEVVAEAGTGDEAVRLAVRLEPDVLLLDMQMPGLTGVEVTRQLQEQASKVRILAFSAYDNPEFVAAVLSAGAAGYLTKKESLDVLVSAVRGVAQGEEGWLSREITAVLVRQRRPSAVEEDPVQMLSTREREVLCLLAQGLSNQQIGDSLFISESTVKKHVNNIYFKLEVDSRAEAVAWAWKKGVATPKG